MSQLAQIDENGPRKKALFPREKRGPKQVPPSLFLSAPRPSAAAGQISSSVILFSPPPLFLPSSSLLERAREEEEEQTKKSFRHSSLSPLFQKRPLGEQNNPGKGKNQRVFLAKRSLLPFRETEREKEMRSRWKFIISLFSRLPLHSSSSQHFHGSGAISTLPSPPFPLPFRPAFTGSLPFSTPAKKGG